MLGAAVLKQFNWEMLHRYLHTPLEALRLLCFKVMRLLEHLVIHIFNLLLLANMLKIKVSTLGASPHQAQQGTPLPLLRQ